MKLLAVIFCLVVSVKAFGQGSDTSARIKPLDSAISKDALYMIDGVASQNKLNDIDPKDIFSVTILKNNSKDPSMNPTNKNVVIVVTKQSAIKMYQKRFSAFSKKYEEYLKSHNNDDSGFLYLINWVSLDQIYIDYGVAKSDTTWEGIRKLFNVPVEKIKKISFLDNNGPAIGKKIVVIKTKN